MLDLCLRKCAQLILLLFSVSLKGVLAKPTFSLPQTFPSLTSITQQIIEDRSLSQMKSYSGYRISNDSLIMIYYHGATVVVTELGPNKLLLGCELIEIYTEKGGTALLENLSVYNRPLEINFDEMLKLMSQCEHVDKMTYKSRCKARAINFGGNTNQLHSKNENASKKRIATNLAATIFPNSPLTLLSGIVPGTKWCGTGDIAETYHDLGTEMAMDRCCRLHDLCPIKIRAFQSKYDLTNDSLYTKSHCICDDMLFGCLKQANTPASELMGSIYFSLVRVPCLDGSYNHFKYREAKAGF